jgi:hypothetical protein
MYRGNTDLLSLIKEYFPSEKIIKTDKQRISTITSSFLSYHIAFSIRKIPIVITDKKYYFDTRFLSTSLGGIIAIDKTNLSIEEEHKIKTIPIVYSDFWLISYLTKTQKMNLNFFEKFSDSSFVRMISPLIKLTVKF